MIAIVKTGGKQYQVQRGDKIEVELLEQEPGKKVEFSEVLLVADDNAVRIGKPFVEKAKVVGTLVREIKGPKLIAFKYRPRENSRRKKGHRQQLSVVTIDEIIAG